MLRLNSFTFRSESFGLRTVVNLEYQPDCGNFKLFQLVVAVSDWSCALAASSKQERLTLPATFGSDDLHVADCAGFLELPYQNHVVTFCVTVVAPLTTPSFSTLPAADGIELSHKVLWY